MALRKEILVLQSKAYKYDNDMAQNIYKHV